jgi:hypothetical protein
VRDSVICDSDLSSSPKNEDQQGLLGTQSGGLEHTRHRTAGNAQA